MKTLIENARLIDPVSGLDSLGKLAISEECIAGVGESVTSDFCPDVSNWLKSLLISQ